MNSAMQAMVQMRMGQPQPPGPNQSLPAGGPPQMPQGPPQGQPQPQPMPVPQPGGGPQGPPNIQALLAQLAQSANGPAAGDPNKAHAMLAQLVKMYPKLKVTENADGKAELVGPAQDQFLGATWAKAHGAKTSKVANAGRGQRLIVSW